MPRRTAYIVVEGQHDVEFIGRILRKGTQAFHFQNAKSKVDPFWHELIPTSYPVAKPPNDFLSRVPMPIFYQNDTHTAAVQSAEGVSMIARRLEETLAVPGLTEPDAIGLILDSDSQETPSRRAADLANELANKLAGAFPSMPGEIAQPTGSARSRRGVFVFPDNANQGSLEDLLLICGRTSYPDLLSLADGHIRAVESQLVPGTPTWTQKDAQEFKAPSGAKKATIASVTAILKPGKTSQVSVNDNRWIESTTLALREVKAVSDWLERLIL